MKKGWGRGISSFILVIFILSLCSIFVISAQSASLRHEFVNGDLKCMVDYFGQPANPVEPDWSWDNEGVDLHISSNTLSRQYFKQNDEVYCNYVDDANDVDLSLKIIIPVTNSPPDISPFDDVKLQKGKIITIVPKIIDVDGDAYEVIFAAPLDANGKWENTMNFATGNYTIQVKVRDTNGGEDTESVNIELLDKFEEQRFNEVLEDQYEDREQDIYREIRDGRYSKIMTIIKKGELVDINIEKEASGKSLSVSRALFSLNKDKLQITTEFRSLGQTAPANIKPLMSEVEIYDFVNVIMYDYNNNDIATSELEFKIDSQWLNDKNRVKIYEYDGDWKEIPSEKIIELTQSSYYKARTNGFGLFAIVGEGENSLVPLKKTNEGFVQTKSGLNDDDDVITGGAVLNADEATNWGMVFFVALAVIGLIFLVSVAMIRNADPSRFSEAKVRTDNRDSRREQDLNRDLRDGDPSLNEDLQENVEDLDEDEIKKRVAMMLQGKREVLEENLSKVEKSHKTKFQGYDETETEMKSYNEEAARAKVRRELEF